MHLGNSLPELIFYSVRAVAFGWWMPAHFKICTCLLDSGQLQFAPVLIGESIESAQTCSCEHVKWLVSCTSYYFLLCAIRTTLQQRIWSQEVLNIWKLSQTTFYDTLLILVLLHCRKWKLKVELCSLQSIILSGIVIRDCHTKPGFSHKWSSDQKEKKKRERIRRHIALLFAWYMIISNCITSPFLT